jgi:hypothetical protein
MTKSGFLLEQILQLHSEGVELTFSIKSPPCRLQMASRTSQKKIKRQGQSDKLKSFSTPL